jgi:hypothetical protein
MLVESPNGRSKQKESNDERQMRRLIEFGWREIHCSVCNPVVSVAKGKKRETFHAGWSIVVGVMLSPTSAL